MTSELEAIVPDLVILPGEKVFGYNTGRLSERHPNEQAFPKVEFPRITDDVMRKSFIESIRGQLVRYDYTVFPDGTYIEGH